MSGDVVLSGERTTELQVLSTGFTLILRAVSLAQLVDALLVVYVDNLPTEPAQWEAI